MKSASNRHHETVVKMGHRKKSIDKVQQVSEVVSDGPTEEEWKQLKI